MLDLKFIRENIEKVRAGLTAKRFKELLDAIPQTQKVTIRIHSDGGDAFEGNAIYNAILAQKSRVSIAVDGLAASAASIIAMAAGRCVMGKASYMMLHKSWTWTMGNADEMLLRAEQLESLDDTMCGIYAARSGKSKKSFADMLDAKMETWLNADECLALGLCDEILDEDNGLLPETARLAVNHKMPPENLRRVAAQLRESHEAFERAQLDQQQAQEAEAKQQATAETVRLRNEILNDDAMLA